MTSLGETTFSTESETSRLLAKSSPPNGNTRTHQHSEMPSGESASTDAALRRRAYQSGPRVSSYGSFGWGKGFSEITLSWTNVNVFLPAVTKLCSKTQKEPPKHILRDVAGAVTPGTLLAIIGASGAGKSTLLNVLNFRNRGNLLVQGDVRVNGCAISSGITNISAYVQQDDLFIGALKVQEHLWFQSMLRMGKHVSKEARNQRVMEVMLELGLTKCKDTVIGIPGRLKGISGGERKRLAFASEVMTNPPLMFCDEPTSGLDSYMAENVVQTLRTMAAKGKTIISTIHQPSSEVYALFDRVLILAEGRTAFMGSSSDALTFFSSVGYECPKNYNPADHFIHTLAIVPGQEEECRRKVEAVCDAFSKSTYKKEVDTIIQESNSLDNSYSNFDETIVQESRYKASWFRQFFVVFWRCWLTNNRTPEILRARIAQTLVISIILGLVYLQQPVNQKGVMNINGVLFIMQIQMTFGMIFTVVNTFIAEFPVFLREHHNGMYRVDVYFLSKMFSELPLFVFIPVMFVSIVYWMVGLNARVDAFLIATAAITLMSNIALSFGYMISSSTSNVAVALGIGPILLLPMMLFGGFFLNTASTPVYFIWLKYLSWFNYCNEIMVVNQWQTISNITCEIPKPFTNVTGLGAVNTRCFYNGDDVIQSLSLDPNNVFRNFMVLIAFMVGFRLISFLLLLLRSRRK